MKGKGVVVKTKGGSMMELDLYLRVVAMNPEDAMALFGMKEQPVDLGRPRGDRYREGARVWGFPSRPETAEEKAHRIWTVANDGEVQI